MRKIFHRFVFVVQIRCALTYYFFDVQAQAIRILATSEVVIGMELPMADEGLHSIQVFVFAADEDGISQPLFVCEPQDCLVGRPDGTSKQYESAPNEQIFGLPRLQQKDSLVLCGVDVPSQAEGNLRIMVALKRIWHDAPREVSYHPKSRPSGENAYSVHVSKCPSSLCLTS
jgi:hypothetical protein